MFVICLVWMSGGDSDAHHSLVAGDAFNCGDRSDVNPRHLVLLTRIAGAGDAGKAFVVGPSLGHEVAEQCSPCVPLTRRLSSPLRDARFAIPHRKHQSLRWTS